MDMSKRLCLNHPDTQAATACKQCHKPLCSACIIQQPDGHFCSDACHHQYGQFKDRRIPEAGPSIFSRLTTLAIYAAIALGILWGLAKFADLGFAQGIMNKLGIPY